MLRIIESVESKYTVSPFENYTFEQILHMLQKDEAQVLTDPDTSEKGVYIPTPKQKPGVKKIAAMTPTRDRQRVVTYGCD